MSVRFLVSNGVKLLLLLPFLLGASDTVKALCAVGLIASLVVDYTFYRRDKRELAEQENPARHVPMPPGRDAR